MNNFTQRILTGAMFIILIVSFLMYGQWPAFLLFSAIVILGTNEYLKLSHIYKKSHQIFTHLIVYSVFALISLWHFKYVSIYYWAIPLLLIYVLFIIQLFSKTIEETKTLALSILAIFYIGIPSALFFGIGHRLPLVSDGKIAYNGMLVLLIFILIWANDSFAYLIGKKWGKHKLLAHISPGKTIEGFIGGVLMTGIFAIALHYWQPVFTIWKMIVLGMVVSVFGVFGDLYESLLKRNANVKDSGNLLPGHGGILDRFDAYYISIPFIYCLIFCFLKMS